MDCIFHLLAAVKSPTMYGNALESLFLKDVVNLKHETNLGCKYEKPNSGHHSGSILNLYPNAELSCYHCDAGVPVFSNKVWKKKL